MSLNKERAFEVLKKISFERIAGTDKELECANILKEEIEKHGIDVSDGILTVEEAASQIVAILKKEGKI